VEKHWKYSMGPRRTASDESWGRPILGGSAQPVYTLLTCFKHTRIYRIYRIKKSPLALTEEIIGCDQQSPSFAKGV
jgi:hypothetical protein